MKAKILRLSIAIALAVSLAVAMFPAGVVMAADTWYVDGALGTDDGAHGTGTGINAFKTIGYAVGQASGGDTIIIAAGTYSPSNNGEAFEIYIDRDLTIQGAGAGVTIVDADDFDRVFHIASCTVEMSGMTIQDGNIWGHGGGIRVADSEVTLTDCTVSDNEAIDDGGGIYNEGMLTMTNCTVSGNEADEGGGIYNYGGQVTMTNCTVSGNTARAGNGGGISTVIEDLTLTITNCTISGNNASGDGGGIYNQDDEVELTNCTITGNTADSGGGVITNVPINITCTIVYGNTVINDGPNLYGPYNDIGNESIVDNPNPLLGPLQDNGGATETHALLKGSPAIDSCTQCTVDEDQRGTGRPQYDHCDIGAYEAEPPIPRITAVSTWGTVGLAVVMAGLLVWSVKRRLLLKNSMK